MAEAKLPNPGSDKAVKMGCTCAVLDNRHGIGAYDGKDGQFWISANCPLHGVVEEIKETRKQTITRK